MATPFHHRIQQALDNPGLQAALDANAERRLKVRLQSYASLPEDIQVMRQRAHEVRARVIANLDDYLGQFIDRAQANGFQIHHAADAAQACRIVLDIARQEDAQVIAKAKTMLGEEIGINQALEAAGLKVVETDLGEYIVQLRGEHPAHILTPAVHLRRSDVAQTFHEKLGMPLTDDIPLMVATARRTLRQTFLDAQVGITGVNFAVAETGGLCLVTNEGNGRLVTTLPPVHIALMGIERLVPTLEDLALMLYLLPRSGTGQKLTVYTSLIHRPRQPGDRDGPRQRHVILLDNGRQAIRRSADRLFSQTLYCIRCGACLNACPIFRELGGHAYVGVSGTHTPYPGPIGSALSPLLFNQLEFGHLARASSLCGACKEACPVDINLPGVLLRIRAGGMQANHNLQQADPAPATVQPAPTHVPLSLNIGLRLFGWVARSSWRYSLSQRLAGIFSRIVAPRSAWFRLPAFTGWGYSKDFPRPAAQPFRHRWASPQPAQVKSQPESTPAISQPRPAEVPTPAAAIPVPSKDGLVARFANELTTVGGTLTACRYSDLLDNLLAFLRQRDILSLQAWEGSFLPAGILDGLRENGIQVSHDPDPSLIVGLTGTSAGIAETGTLVLTGGEGHPLTASLLPEIHLAILRAEDLCASLPQALRLPQIKQAPATVLITGPSRTADIEMTLSIGVHGPREVHVFFLED